MAVYQTSKNRTLKIVRVEMFDKDKEKLKKLCKDRNMTQAEMIEDMLKNYKEE
jgi:hypothetical protein